MCIMSSFPSLYLWSFVNQGHVRGGPGALQRATSAVRDTETLPAEVSQQL